MTIKSKLNRLKNHITQSEVETPLSKQQNKHGYSQDIDIPYREEWTALDSNPFYFNDQYSIIREVRYPIDYQHGAHRFNELFDVIKQWEETKVEHPLSFANQDTDKMIFLDTETTGLSGGVGNTIFLVGYAQVFYDHVLVKQHFLPNPSCEIALYQGFLSDIDDYQTMKLTTYNGKAFDWPQIKTRHTLIREAVPNLPPFGHFDLLHAARRLWKNKLPSVRLAIVEKELLNIKRESDVPGYLAPMLYFDFLKDNDPKGLEGVFIHNEIDVLSLISLYIHISKKILNDPSLSIEDEEHYEIARWFEGLGETDSAINYYRKLSIDDNKIGDQAKHKLAFLYKKKKQYDKATQLWLQLWERKPTIDVDLAIELSKLYEHQWKDYDKALFFTKQGYDALLKKKSVLKTTGQHEKVDLLKRIERLQRKIQS